MVQVKGGRRNKRRARDIEGKEGGGGGEAAEGRMSKQTVTELIKSSKIQMQERRKSWYGKEDGRQLLLEINNLASRSYKHERRPFFLSPELTAGLGRK